MNIKTQYIALYTLVRRELVRMFRISSQVFLPAVITTSLYFLIFGTLIGKRIGPVDHVSYSLFIAPGLVMMTVITNSYGNVSTSLFSARFQRNIEELLVSPLSLPLLLLGYLIGGLVRGLIVAILVFLVASCFVSIDIHRLPLTLMIVFLVSGIFSLAGFTNALLARTFDDVMLVPTFLLTPLTYLGGVFYSTHMLTPFWNNISHFNPIWYMVHAMRYAMLGYSEVDIRLSIFIIVILFLGLLVLNLVLLKKGVGLRE
jgi:ABC-2 type transport system permease protein